MNYTHSQTHDRCVILVAHQDSKKKHKRVHEAVAANVLHGQTKHGKLYNTLFIAITY